MKHSYLRSSVITAALVAALALSWTAIYSEAKTEGRPPVRQLVLFDQKGRRTAELGQPGAYYHPVFSPDGARIAVVLGPDIWVFDVLKGTGRQLTATPAPEASQVWSPDGSHIAYISNRGGAIGVYQKASDGTGPEEQLYVSDGGGLTDWTRDGHFILSFIGGPQSPAKGDLFLLPVHGDRKPIPLLSTPANEVEARLSPDGRFIAYRSDESGANEIYVRSFNAPPGGVPSLGSDKWKVSIKGGLLARWRNDGKELYYLAANGDMKAVKITTTPRFQARQESILFHVVSTFPLSGIPGGFLDISRDGKRFALLLSAEE